MYLSSVLSCCTICNLFFLSVPKYFMFMVRKKKTLYLSVIPPLIFNVFHLMEMPLLNQLSSEFEHYLGYFQALGIISQLN